MSEVTTLLFLAMSRPQLYLIGCMSQVSLLTLKAAAGQRETGAVK